MSGFGGLEIARKALMAQKLSMEIAGQNIANVNTPGYSRQVAIHGASLATVAASARSSDNTLALSGVEVTQIRRQYDAYLDNRLRDLSSQVANTSAQFEALSKLEEILREPSDAGIGSAMEEFWTAWAQLATTPSSMPNRLDVVFRGLSLTEAFHQAGEQLESLRQEALARANEYTMRLNDLAASLADLNKVMTANAPVAGQLPPGNLLDRRDQLLREISGIAAVTTKDMGNGVTNISLGGWSLVEGGVASRLSLEQPQPQGEITLTWSGRAIAAADVSGALGGNLIAYNDTLNGFQSKLNELAAETIRQVNSVHRQGFDRNGQPGQDFFTGTNATDISVVAELFDAPHLLAASAADTAADGNLAQRIADLRKNGAGVDDKCVSTFYREVIAELGTVTRSAGNLCDNTQALVQYTEQRLQSISGVSLDEELSDLVMYQQAYSAAARVLTIMDETLDVLINRTGLVGRR